jgi:hypothetical protein|tara:strand:- start:397 stop:609 length:213 start_codon:yes stop_codon:yes gene_type:complete
MKPKLSQKSFRINQQQLDKLRNALGVDESKAVRAAINCANNVIHNIFGGEITLIFKRRKDNEELDLYENL